MTSLLESGHCQKVQFLSTHVRNTVPLPYPSFGDRIALRRGTVARTTRLVRTSFKSSENLEWGYGTIRRGAILTDSLRAMPGKNVSLRSLSVLTMVTRQRMSHRWHGRL